jgi:hypothetical protein
MKATSAAKKTVLARSDSVDSVLALGCAAIIWIVYEKDVETTYLPTYPLLGLVLVCLWRRRAVPEMKRGIQMLAGFVLSLAAAVLTIIVPMENHILRICLPVFFLYSAYYLGVSFVAQTFGLKFAEAIEIPELRRFLFIPSVIAQLVAVAGITFLTFQQHQREVLIVFWLWLVPYLVFLYFMRTVELEVVRTYFENASHFRRAFGKHLIIFSAIALTISLGVTLGLLTGRGFFLWFPISVLLALQALVISRVQKWADAIEV